jgi:ABC-2 type transport system ATP-binding protein
MIRLSHVTKSFGHFNAVEDCSLEIQAGEFFGFLGPNGAGKTTTIRMMVGLYAPTSGHVLIDGVDVVAEPVNAKLHLGYIPDQPFIYEKLTGREFLYFSAGLYRMRHHDATERIRWCTERLEIDSWIDQRAEHYSQGMRQRISIAAALLHRPKVLIIDEPMVGLDPRSAALVRALFQEQSRDGVAVFMSTHLLPIAEQLCTRIGVIRKGRMIFDGTVEEVRQKGTGSAPTFESAFFEMIG